MGVRRKGRSGLVECDARVDAQIEQRQIKPAGALDQRVVRRRIGRVRKKQSFSVGAARAEKSFRDP